MVQCLGAASCPAVSTFVEQRQQAARRSNCLFSQTSSRARSCARSTPHSSSSSSTGSSRRPRRLPVAASSSNGASWQGGPAQAQQQRPQQQGQGHPMPPYAAWPATAKVALRTGAYITLLGLAIFFLPASLFGAVFDTRCGCCLPGVWLPCGIVPGITRSRLLSCGCCCSVNCEITTGISHLHDQH